MERVQGSTERESATHGRATPLPVDRTVVLDTSPLGLLTQSTRFPQAVACNEWLESLLAAGVQVIVAEIADYETRRELLRLNATAGIARLDALEARLE